MPELAEVAYYANQWRPGLGEPIRDVLLHPKKRIFRGCDANRLPKALTGTTLDTIQTHGKQMLFGFAGGHWLPLHLGMTGKLATRPADHPQEKHDHLVLVTPTQQLVFTDPRMFGRVTYAQGGQPPETWTSQPPQVHTDTFTKTYLAEKLARRTRSLLKPVLLDQNIFPGIGNWMADEVAWRCHLHPATRVGELGKEDIARLWKQTRQVSRDAMRVIAPDWSHPPDSWLFNHRWKDGGDCPRCHAPLLREKIQGRTACWCPQCQAPR